MPSSFYGPEVSATFRQQWYRALFTYAPTGIAVLDTKGRISESNVVCSTLLEYSSAELADAPLESFLHRSDAKVIQKALAKLVTEDNGVANLRLNFVTKTGQMVLLQTVILPVRDERSMMANYMAYLLPVAAVDHPKDRSEPKPADDHSIKQTLIENWQWVLGSVATVAVAGIGFYVQFQILQERQVRQEAQIEKILQTVEKISGPAKTP